MMTQMTVFRLTIISLLSAVWAVSQETVPGTEQTVPGTKQAAEVEKPLSELVDGLNQSDLQMAYQLLRSEYIKKEDLNDLNLNRAALQGLIERLGFGAKLLTTASMTAEDSPYGFYETQISNKIGYVRFGKFTNDELAKFDQVIADYNNEDKVATMILDLRSPQAQADFAVAADILSRLRPPNEMLFKISRPDTERPVLFRSKASDTSWADELVVLVDSETGNVGEIIAKVLQSKSESIVIGAKTKGLTVEYRDTEIGENLVLRYAIAEVILENENSIFQKGIVPDLLAESDLRAKNQFFSETNNGESITPYVFQVERPRFNERALVAGTDPELEYRLAIMNDKKTEWNTERPEDKVLQKAVDILRTRYFLESGKRKRKLR